MPFKNTVAVNNISKLNNLSMIINLAEKTKAASVHLILSALVISLFFALIFYIWFPNGLIYAGALEGLQLVILVDLVLGPLLTFVVFNKTKRSLKWDLSIIVLIQLAALVYGASLILKERPVAAVLGSDFVHLVTASEAEQWELPKTFSTHTGPKTYYLDVENDLAKLMPAEAVHEFTEGKPFHIQPDLYKNLNTVSESTYDERINLLIERHKHRKAYQRLLDQQNNDGCTWLIVMSKHVFDQGFVCFHRTNGIMKTKIVKHDV